MHGTTTQNLLIDVRTDNRPIRNNSWPLPAHWSNEIQSQECSHLFLPS